MAQPLVMGVDVGGTKILVGLVDEHGQELQSQKFPMVRANQETVLASIGEAVERFMQIIPAGVLPEAIGVGLVGFVDPVDGVWIHSMNLRVDHPVPLATHLSHLYHLPVYLDNDVHAATLAEMRLGIGRQSQNFIYLNVGTGIAAGIVCNGELVRGAANYAGEMGHILVEPNGEECVCGQRGCMEPIASGGGILSRVRANLPKFKESPLYQLDREGTLSAIAVFEAEEQGDRLAAWIAGEAIRALGAALVDVINLLNPEYIVLGGGMVTSGPVVRRVQEYVAEHALPSAYQSLKGIVPSALAVDRVGLLGAASLAWNSIHIDNRKP